MGNTKHSLEIFTLIKSYIMFVCSFVKVLSANVKCYMHTHIHIHTGFRPPWKLRYILIEDRYKFLWNVHKELLNITDVEYMVTCDPDLEGARDKNTTSTTGNSVIMELGYGFTYTCRLLNNVRPSEAIFLRKVITTVESGMFKLEPSIIL